MMSTEVKPHTRSLITLDNKRGLYNKPFIDSTIGFLNSPLTQCIRIQKPIHVGRVAQLLGFTHGYLQSYRIDRFVKRPSKLVSPQNTQDALEKILQLIGHSSLAFAGKFVSVCCLFYLQIIHTTYLSLHTAIQYAHTRTCTV